MSANNSKTTTTLAANRDLAQKGWTAVQSWPRASFGGPCRVLYWSRVGNPAV